MIILFYLNLLYQYKPGKVLISFNFGLSSSTIFDLFNAPSYLLAILSIKWITIDTIIAQIMKKTLYIYYIVVF